MKVVSNAGPLMALGKLGLIHILYQLYGPVLAPTAVYEEVVDRGLELGLPDAHMVQLAIARQELVVVSLNEKDLSSQTRNLPLGRGERQAIYLGLAEKADWVLLDDLLAREQAQRLGLNVKGTLGIIAGAYRQKLMSLQEVEIIFQAILEREDIWISEALLRRVRNALERRAPPPSPG